MKPRIGIALGAGGARGFCHIGVLKELQAQNRAPQIVSGSSIGALVGACYAAGRLQELENWARSLNRFKAISLWDITPTAGGLVKAAALQQLAEELSLPDRIEDLDIPFAAVATDMVSGGEVVFHSGSLFDAIRASVSLPGLISPHFYQGRWLLDGGLVNPIPSSVVRELGAQIIITANPNARLDGVIWREDDQPPQQNAGDSNGLLTGLLGKMAPGANGPVSPSITQVVWTSIEIMMDRIQRARLAGDPPHIQLNGTLGDMPLMELHTADKAIAEGHQMVSRQREFIDALATN